MCWGRALFVHILRADMSACNNIKRAMSGRYLSIQNPPKMSLWGGRFTGKVRNCFKCYSHRTIAGSNLGYRLRLARIASCSRSTL